uniref:Uncharacterized protein n=1 Tax=Nelumbo nucifera TaxID=4432 RepID=A0A822Y667_NELNU|nr:TPA_asm: hypothetical protein HUJ06_028589 [Nelumbo nucifera]
MHSTSVSLGKIGVYNVNKLTHRNEVQEEKQWSSSSI